MVIAHEFFDALPFHLLQVSYLLFRSLAVLTCISYQKTETGWNEVMIASTLGPITDPRTSSELKPLSPLQNYPRLRRVLSPTPTATSRLLGLSSPRFQNLPIGSSIEVSPASFKIARQIGELLKPSTEKRKSVDDTPEALRSGGCGLIIDYGGAKAFGNSFRVCFYVPISMKNFASKHPRRHSKTIKSWTSSTDQEIAISLLTLTLLLFKRLWETLVRVIFLLLLAICSHVMYSSYGSRTHSPGRFSGEDGFRSPSRWSGWCCQDYRTANCHSRRS